MEFDALVESTASVSTCVKQLVLRRPDGADLPPWTPGAHIDLFLANGTVRQYSLCGRPEDRQTWRIAVLREPDGSGRGGSEYVHRALHSGSLVRVSAPRNNFRLIDAESYLFVAGGIGITPILPMVAAAESSGADWSLAYGGRSAATMAFRDELAAYGDRVSVLPEDECGRLDLAGLLAGVDQATAVYCCGPAPLLEVIEQACADRAAGSLHVERFIPRAGADTHRDRPFEVVLAKQDRSFEVPPGESILHTLESNGIDVPSSCRQGMCGTCEQALLEGEPDHRDEILTPEERAAGEYILICVSRCRGDRLVLDL
ncbi:oxidoreductase [Rhodococcus wratislaviensis]|nr:oxidoreductase [Rhodococcus sp. 3A]MBC2897584.1 oxidoreductase [Rhodococcus sp. 4CII]